jgi:formyl-CoA transferase
MGNEFIFAAPASCFACKDGHVFAGVLLDSHWKVLARFIGRPDLADHPDYATTLGRLSHRSEVNALMTAWCAERRVSDVVEQFASEGIPAAPVNSYVDAARDSHVLARDMLQPVAVTGGAEVPLTGPAAKFSRTPTRVRSAAPALGAHTDEVLAEVGLSAAELERLRQDGVL